MNEVETSETDAKNATEEDLIRASEADMRRSMTLPVNDPEWRMRDGGVANYQANRWHVVLNERVSGGYVRTLCRVMEEVLVRETIEFSATERIGSDLLSGLGNDAVRSSGVARLLEWLKIISEADSDMQEFTVDGVAPGSPMDALIQAAGAARVAIWEYEEETDERD